MSNGKKYGAHAMPGPSGTWSGRVVRHRTSRGTVIERERNGFASRDEAQAWAVEQLAIYLAQRKERNARNNANRSATKIRRVARAAILAEYSYRELALRSATESDCLSEFKYRSELLWKEVAFRRLKEGATDDEAIIEANKRVGAKHRERLEKGLSGHLDTVAFGTRQLAFANAQFLLQQGIAQLS